MFKPLTSTLLIASLGFILHTPIAYAQSFEDAEEEEEKVLILNPFDEQYRPNPNSVNKGVNRPASPLAQGAYRIHIKDAVTGRQGDLKISLQPSGSVTGCLATKTPVINKTMSGKKMTLEITENVITANQYQARYNQYECEIESSGPFSEIILNRDELIRNGIEELIIKEEDMGPVAIYELEFTRVSGIFKKRYPEYQEPFLQEQEDARTIWFKPNGTYLLFNAGLDFSDTATHEKAIALAQQKGLTLIEDTDPAFARLQATFKEHNKGLLVVDTENRFANEFEDLNNAFTLGNIPINQLYGGPQGAVERPVEKPVFARIAGGTP